MSKIRFTAAMAQAAGYRDPQQMAEAFQDASFAAYYHEQIAERGLSAGVSLDERYVNGQPTGERPWVTVQIAPIEPDGADWVAQLNSKCEAILARLDRTNVSLPAIEDLEGVDRKERAQRSIDPMRPKPRTFPIDARLQPKEPD